MNPLDALNPVTGSDIAAVGPSNASKTPQSSFGDILKKTLSEVNDTQLDAEKATVDLATGQIKDIHQAAIAINKAELSMKMVLEVRNKAISAYKEILRTQI